MEIRSKVTVIQDSSLITIDSQKPTINIVGNGSFGGGAGEINIGQNIGSGAAVYTNKVGVALQFRRILGINGISANSISDTINIRLGGTINQDTTITDDGTHFINFTNLGSFGITAGNLQVTASNYAAISATNNISLSSGSRLFRINSGSGGVELDLGSDSEGDMYFRNSAGILTRLPIGSNGQAIISNGTTPAYGNIISSIALSVPSFLQVTGSPLTSSGTLDVDLANQTANTIFAGPDSGPDAQPSFRLLVSSDIPDLSSMYLPLSGGTLTGDLTLAGSPTNADHAATKAYVDSVASGLSWKSPVDLATTADITLSGEQTIDGILTSASRILVKDQADQTQNGIYVTDSGSWIRSSDADLESELQAATLLVLNGTVNANSQWTCTTFPTTFGADPIEFSQIAVVGTYINGTGLDLTGNVFSISTNGVSNGMIRQSAAYSVIGNPGNSTANVDDIVALNDGDVLQLSGGALGFAPLSVSSLTMNQDRILGRTTAGIGTIEELQVNNGLTLSSGFIKLGGTLSEATTITSNVANRFRLTGSWTASSSNQYHELIDPILTGSGTTSHILHSSRFAPTLIAGANNQLLSAVTIDPTFTLGATTGVLPASLYVSNGRTSFGILPSLTISHYFSHAATTDSSVIGVRGNSLGATSSALEVTGTTITNTTSISSVLGGSPLTNGSISSYTQGIDQWGLNIRVANSSSHGIKVSNSGEINADSYNGHLALLQYSTNGVNMTANATNPMLSIHKVNSNLNGFNHTGAFIDLVNGFSATGDFIKAHNGSGTTYFKVNSSGYVQANFIQDDSLARVIVSDSNGNLFFRAAGTLGGGSSVANFTDLGDVPNSYTGQGTYVVSVKADESGLEFTPANAGTVTSVTGTSDRITSTNGTTPVIDIAASYVGQSSITTLGTISTGTWQGNVIGITYGGTGLASIGTASQLIRVNGAGNALEYFTPTYISGNQTITLSGDISGSGTTSITTAIGPNKVLNSMIRQSSGLSIIGRSANTSGDVSDITAGTDNTILSRSGTTIGFNALTAAMIPDTVAWKIGGNTLTGASLLGTASNQDITFQTGAAELKLRTNSNDRIIVRSDGRVSFNETTLLSSSYVFKSINDSNDLMRLRDASNIVWSGFGNGTFNFGNWSAGANLGFTIFPSAGNNTSLAKTGNTLIMESRAASDTATGHSTITIRNINPITANISGDSNTLRLAGIFSPTSGSQNYQSITINTTINQTGSTGMVTGVDYNPTITAVSGIHAGIVIRPTSCVNGFGVTTPTAIVDLAASTTTRASLRMRSGTAPTSPNDGDIWFDGADVKIRISGVTRTFTLI